jgi:hypothetical protein
MKLKIYQDLEVLETDYTQYKRAKMILEFPNYISTEVVKRIRDSVKPFIDPSRPTKYNRDGYTVNISRTLELKELDNELHNIFSKIQHDIVQHRYSPIYNSGDEGYEYHIYNPNDICRYHVDSEFQDTNVQQTTLRYASVVIHLNTVTEGGELVFPNQNKSIKTEEGKLVVFPPYGMFGHYTTPSNQVREVIVSWFIYQGLTVNKNI